MYKPVIDYIRKVYNAPEGFVPLHAPYFGGNEKKYLADTIDSTFVSSVGAYVNRFEDMMAEITGAKYAVATSNGTVALQLALVVAGVKAGDEVITQPLTFIATANAIAHSNATPVFIDVDKDTMGMSPDALEDFLKENATVRDGAAYNNTTGKRIAACVPMHTFGFPCRTDRIKGQDTGTCGLLGTFSFHGNKTVSCGGGGAIVTNDEALAKHAKHISTTAKIPHPWEFAHDEIGYNFRLPNLNAALACAQLEQLDGILQNKRDTAALYEEYFKGTDIGFVSEMEGSKANYWLNCIVLNGIDERNAFLEATNGAAVMTRPIWKLTNKLDMYKHCQHGDLSNSLWLEDRIVNIPSSYRP